MNLSLGFTPCFEFRVTSQEFNAIQHDASGCCVFEGVLKFGDRCARVCEAQEGMS